MTSQLQRLSGSFPGIYSGSEITLGDAVTNGSGWSQGVQTIVPVTAQPTITNPWTIISWSIAFSMLLYTPMPSRFNGLLGKLYGGLLLGGSVAPQQDGNPFNPGSFPSDPTTLALLWDGASDATPPWSTSDAMNTGAANVDTFSGQLPVPLAMAPSDKLGMGLWLTPSIAAPIADGGYFFLCVIASYAIQYTTGS